MLLLKNATYIDYLTLDFKSCHIIVNEGKDEKIEFHDTIPEINISDYDIIDCNGKFVTKSFACGHHHIYSALSRGMPAPKKRITSFYENLQYIWWVLDRALDKEMIEASALASAIFCAKSGTTFVIDHHSSQNYINGSLEIIGNALEKAGLSHLLCFETTDRNGYKKTQEGLEETEAWLEKHQGLVGLHASFTVSNDTLVKAVELAEKYNSGIHIHVAEDEIDQRHCKREYGIRVMKRLYDAGALKFPKTILGHCLHLDVNEKDIFKNTPAWIVQNTESNLNNNVGVFNSEWLNDRIIMGTDGMHSDMIRSAKFAYLVGRGSENANPNLIYERFRRVHDYLNENKITGDAANNLVVLDYDTPTDFSKENFTGHFIYGIESKHIQHVISDGKLIVKDKKITTLDEEVVLKYAKEQSKRLWNKMAELA